MQTGRLRLVRDPDSHVEAIHARFAGHAYDLHRHDEWLVGVTEQGVQDFLCRGVRRRSLPGGVMLIEPQEGHDGEAGAADGFAYHMLYLPHGWLHARRGVARDEPIGFRATLADDARLGAAIRAAYASLEAPDPRLRRDAMLDAVVARLQAHFGWAPAAVSSERDNDVARRAREHMLDTLANDIGADALARAAGAADRFRLARAFRAAYGAAPHALLVQQRLVRARALLARGGQPAAIAAECGFADQSHLGRWFRRAYGVTPAAYRASCTGVPDNAAAMRH